MNQIIANRAAKYLFYACIAAVPLWLAWIAFDYIFAKNCFYKLLPLRFGGSALSILILISLKRKWLSASLTQILMFIYYNVVISYMLSIVDLNVLDIYFNGYSMIMIIMFFILILNWIDLMAFIFIVLVSFVGILVFSSHSSIEIFGHGGFVFLTTFVIMIIFGFLRYQGVLRDISLTAEIEKAKETKELNIILENANKEKETLLKEIHHRVKNNLQVISSILSLQNSYIKDVETTNVLQESIHRIKSMSIIHETLYKSKNFASIDFSDYLYELTKDIISIYKNNTKLELKIEKDLEELHLDINQAIPSGLIVNELITNSVKYAFNNQNSGQIYLSVKEKEGIVYIEIGDNGCGLPQDFDIEKAESLGLQLVLTLVEQLDGTLQITSENGTLFKIQFVLNKKI